jgi:FtsH-binding integral membrane protein
MPMKIKRNLIKWFLFVVLTPAQFYIAMLIGIVVISIADNFCPHDPSFYNNGANCTLEPPLSTLFFSFGTSLAAFLVVLVGSLTCPIQNKKTPYLIFSLGAVVTGIFAVMLYSPTNSNTETVIMVVATLLTGFATAIFMAKHLTRRLRQATPARDAASGAP